ncbi:tetratricopeptide repeat protein [Deinococcus aquaedulcis]|uniref:tetratricopeptide repeat protein n=1 Tax=Deinococcus aquaedulcis TaxID=2840455 RepID=UPI001F418B5F|nr:tetratricopeptide repeat protein [Deinococcus aquaedulcis]
MRSSVLPWPAWRQSLEALIQTGPVNGLLLTFRQAVEEARGPTEFAELLALLEQADAAWDLGPEATRWRWRCAANLPDAPERLDAWVNRAAQAAPLAPFMQVYRAWALARQEHFEQAQATAAQALTQESELSPYERYLAYRTLARSQLMLGAERGWEAAAQEALKNLSGVRRGLTLMDLGAALSHRGREAQAMQLFSEALPLVKHAPELHAWVLTNMATVCLRLSRLEEAEAFSARASRQRTSYESRALSGQGAARRAFGEWARAASLYERAARTAKDEDDLRQALRGLGHTWRLAGQVARALEPLQSAAQAVTADREAGVSWVNVDLAAAHVSWPQRDADLDVALIHELLSQTGPLGQEEQGRAALVRAEVLRRTGQPDAARALLTSLPSDPLWMREEAHAFADLFTLLPEAERPQPLPRAAQLEVTLRVMGVPDVRVGGRSLPLAPGPLVALCALVEAGGRLTTEALMEVLRPEGDAARTERHKGQRVSAVMRQLRSALGWEASVVSRGGAYHLDDTVRWTSDVLDALERGEPIDAYCTGIHLPWATAREQQLILGDSDDWLDH